MLHPPSNWFHVYESRTSARARLFCFAHAGGPAATYRPWRAIAPDDVEIVAIELPARRARIAEPPLLSITAIIDALAPVIERHLDLPYALFGHSMGAIVAFELARRIRHRGWTAPRHLFVSGARAPQLTRAPDLHALPRDAFLAAVVALGGLPAALAAERELMDMVMPSLRADFTAIETWRYSAAPPFEYPITTFGGSDDPRVDSNHLQAWSEHTTMTFRSQIFPGGHFYLEDHRAELVRSLQF